MLRHLPVQVRPVISDKDWTNLSRSLHFPDEARSRLDELIIILKKNLPGELALEPPARTRKHLDELSGQAIGLIRSFSHLASGSPALWACAEVMSGENQGIKEASARAALSDAISSLGTVSGMLDRASKSIKPGRPGRHGETLRTVIGFLNLLLISFTGHGISRRKSTFRLTMDLLKLSGHDISEDSVSYAIRNLLPWTQEEARYFWGYTTEAPDSIAELERLSPCIESLERKIADAKRNRRATQRARRG